jgi:peptidoglycan/xylan/chitin deacetylase (PgdA/CDA1 family)
MVRSSRFRIATAAGVILVAVLGLVELAAQPYGRTARARGAVHGALDGDAGPDGRDRAGGRKRHGVRSDDQVIERVRRITPWVTKGDTHKKLVALTFDDGPGPLTPAFLAELRRLHAPATFFQVAQSVNAYPHTARVEQRPPFAVGSHTGTHAHLPAIGPGGQRREITGGARTVDQIGHKYPRMFRPPYGEWNDATLDELRRHRMLMVLWTITSSDWTGIGADAIAQKVVNGVHPGSIVLMHDFGGVTREPTLHALPRIVRALRRKGYRFVTVPRMLREAPPRHRPPRPPAPYPA